MEIYKDDFGLLAQVFDLRRHDEERIFNRGHEGAALGVEHRDLDRTSVYRLLTPDFKHAAACPRRSFRIIQRTQEPLLIREQFRYFLLVPEMITAGDDINAESEQLRRNAWRDAVAAGGVLTVGDDEIQPVLLAQLRQQQFDRPASWFAYYVADEKNLHADRLTTNFALRKGI